MAAVDGPARDPLIRDLHALSQDVDNGISPRRTKAAQTAWRVWTQFCATLAIDPGLSDFRDPVPVLMLFARQWREGSIAPLGQHVRARTAKDAVRFVGQAFAAVGSPDPRLNAQGKMDFRLSRQVSGWRRADPPSQRRDIIPRSVLLSLSQTARRLPTAQNLAAVDLLWIGLHFLLRPSEYLHTNAQTYTQAFTMADVLFFCDGHELGGPQLQLHHVPARAALHFTQQKNGISGDTIWLSCTSDPSTCPVQALTQRIRHLQENRAAPTTPLFTFYPSVQRPFYITSRILTAMLRISSQTLCPDLNPTVACLGATGATALLSAGTSDTVLKLLGRWRSDEVFRYLHTTSTLTHQLSQQLMDNAT